ncbi:hypothetical protein [Larkinella terrae]|uniref:Uncharacterized protein n=1 Tax=Larkinella terrae TaxID=2025311 RepID=A0A7K0EMM5_9BACT|nr:hypothetical protein [Larkinella terrae]MRS62962.1 hypothetical protein [Larkinella terrae]
MTLRNKLEGVGTINNHSATFTASAGLAYLLGDRFIVEATLGEVHAGRNFSSSEVNLSSWNSGLSATLQPAFTINYVFN